MTIEVTQADREAAWPYAGFHCLPDRQMRERWFSGYYDNLGQGQAIRDFARRRQQAERGEAWRPIETAPKDGTDFLAVVAGKHPVTGAPYTPEVIGWDEGSNCWRNCMWPYDMDNASYQPTHWMPLPTPPEAV